MTTGHVTAVTRDVLGDQLVADAAIAATTLAVGDVADFDEDGGSLLLGGLVYEYVGIDDDAATIDLAVGLTAAAFADDRVDLWDPEASDVIVEYLADVTEDGGESGDPIQALIPHNLIDLLPEGVRGEVGESVEMEAEDDAYVVTAVNGKVPVIDGGYVEVNGSPLGDALDGLATDLTALDATLATLSTTTIPGLAVDLAAAQADIATAQADIVTAQSGVTSAATSIATLTGTTIPALNSTLTSLGTTVSTVTGTTIPAMQSNITAAQSSITTLTGTTIPALNSTLSTATGNITTLQGKFPITGPDIAANAVTANAIAADAVTAVKILAGSIVTAKIAAGAVTANEIAAATITAAKIVAGTITATELASNSVTTVKLDALAVTAAKIAANTITAAQIQADTLTANEIAAGAITTTELAALAVTAAKIAANTITAGQIAAGTITATEIAASTITAGKIAAATITATQIAANTITAAQIAAGTITATEIAAGTITTAKLNAAAIDGMTITGATLRTAATGERIIVRNDGSGGVIESYSGFSGESPGVLDPSSFDPGDGGGSRPNMLLRVGTTSTFADYAQLYLISGKAAALSPQVSKARLTATNVDVTADYASTPAGRGLLNMAGRAVTISAFETLPSIGPGKITLDGVVDIPQYVGAGSVGTGTFRDSVLAAGATTEAALTSTASPTSTTNITLAGMSVSVASPGTSAVYQVEIVADVAITTAGTTNVIELLVDGTAQTKIMATGRAGAGTSRGDYFQRWRITGLSAGSHTFTARTRCTAAGASDVTLGNTSLFVKRDS